MCGLPSTTPGAATVPIVAGERAWEDDDQPIDIVPYDRGWSELFAIERNLLEGALGGLVDGGIHHVGSTAVPGLAAKPIIDVMAGVRGLDEAIRSFDALARLGYCGWPHRPWMHWFCKPSPAARTHHLHLIEPGHPQFTARLAFRDALRAEPETAAAYAALKGELAARYRGDREAYTEAKSAFIEAVVERVRQNA